ncbi:helix-turn-helix domain-containing protein [Halapricum salinum]|uniref:Helix-turn-helix domain-containing protein n=1 Tax=Halapricum salinum TaxID=1457250 RepID=A0A4D6HEI0_9EURY|nr:helix-turn-helix domain-containing protein [Halapricum salinum]QCC52190.1 helix-turn-helix domain-containing protein [Halapricum salinum]
MKHVSLTLREPPERRNDMHTFIVETPGYEETALLAWNDSRPDLDVFLFRVVGPIEPYRDAIAEPAFVREYDLTPIDDDSFYAYVENEPRDVDVEFQAAFTDNRVLSVPPIVFDADGSTRARVVGESSALESVVADIPDDIDLTIEEIGEFDAPWRAPATLTDRQRETLEVAFDSGYYDLPRAGSIEQIADRLDVAPSTASNHLRKAERALVAQYLGE